MTINVLNQHINVTAKVAGGKACITGHRITVQNIVIWHERMGKSADEIAIEYELSLAEVYAALSYYFDHRAEIDDTIEKDNAFAEELKQKNISKLQQKLQGK